MIFSGNFREIVSKKMELPDEVVVFGGYGQLVSTVDGQLIYFPHGRNKPAPLIFESLISNISFPASLAVDIKRRLFYIGFCNLVGETLIYEVNSKLVVITVIANDILGQIHAMDVDDNGVLGVLHSTNDLYSVTLFNGDKNVILNLPLPLNSIRRPSDIALNLNCYFTVSFASPYRTFGVLHDKTNMRTGGFVVSTFLDKLYILSTFSK